MSVIIPSSKHRQVSVYHTRRCNAVEKMKTEIEIPLGKAKERGLTECKACTQDVDRTKADFSYFMAAKNAGKADD